MPSIVIEQPTIEYENKKARLSANIMVGDRVKVAYFQVDEKYADYFVTEVCDAFVVALIPYAMKNNYNIICNSMVSSRLYYQLTNYVIPTISKFNGILKNKIKISAKLFSGQIASAGAIGTAISGGVDSFYTILRQNAIEQSEYKITHVTYFNAGANDVGKEREELFLNRSAKLQECAGKLGLEYVEIDTNISKVAPIAHLEAHVFRNCGVVLALQKLFGVYLYATTVPISEFDVTNMDPGYYDSFLLENITTDAVTFYSAFPDVNRLEKEQFICDYPITYEYLDVCFGESPNCGKCEKCRRTMMGLYITGALDLYQNVFPVEEFKKSIHRHIGRLLHDSSHNEFARELCTELNNNKAITFSDYYYEAIEFIKDALRPMYHLIKNRGR